MGFGAWGCFRALRVSVWGQGFGVRVWALGLIGSWDVSSVLGCRFGFPV